jgi:diguanylate cyclase (GGDEF)-like protein
MTRTPHERRTTAPVILVVDDSDAMRMLLREMLAGQGYRIEEAVDGNDALLRFEQLRPDMVLLDLVMPEMDGATLCRKLRETVHGGSVPVLMVTMSEDPQSVERAFDAGVTDYVTKPVHMPVLRKRVEYLLKAGAAERHIRHLAFHDTLTGLPNRMLLADRLSQAIEQSKRMSRSVAVMFIDLDQFKWVNDTLGHDAGDDLLRIVAARLSACVRASDTVARLGGDEFVLVLDSLRGPEDATRVAQKLLDTIQAPMTVSGREVRVGGSIGIAVYPSDGEDVEQLMKHADTAMYRAKEGGRNQYRFFKPQMGDAVERHMAMVSHLRAAIESSDGLVLHFMPQVSLRDGGIVVIESLVRWNHPQLGLLGAGEFLPLAEQTGMARALDERVLRLVCDNIAQWRARGIELPAVSVNFSAAHFRERNSVSKIAGILDDSGAIAANLVIEISELVTLGQGDNVGLALNAVRELGVGLCVDDFGAGSTALANLVRFPINAVKLEPGIARAAAGGGRDATLVRGLVALARSLNLDVIAEGVETDRQLAALRELGCDQAQGFVFGKPFAAEELDEVLARNRAGLAGGE